MNLSPMGSGSPLSNSMEGGEALSANLAKSAQELEGKAALALLASSAQVLNQVTNPVGSTGSTIGQHINIAV